MERIAPRQPGPSVWEKTIPNRLPELMRAIEELSAFLVGQNADGKALHIAQLAVEEMGTNIIKYGFDDQGEHPITVQAQCFGEMIELRLSDGGHAFDPTGMPEANSQASLEERTPGGWGISLVRKLVAEMAYQRTEAQNVLTLRFRRSSATD